MYRHPISAMIRLFPALAWVCVGAVGVWTFLRFFLFTPDGWSDSGRDWLDTLFPFGFLAVAAYGVYMAHKECKRVLPALRADVPVRFPKVRQPRVQPHPGSYPLAAPLRVKLRQALESLEAAGALQAGEAGIEDVIACAEVNDEYSAMDLFEVMPILHDLQSQRPFVNLAFFAVQVEIDKADVLEMVSEFARLSGQSQLLGTVRVRGVGGGAIVPARGGEFPPDNAQLEFTLGTRRYVVPFVMYSKNLPGGLMERLAEVFTRKDEPRRFFQVFCDNFVSLAYLHPEKTAALNSALSGESDGFRPAAAAE